MSLEARLGFVLGEKQAQLRAKDVSSWTETEKRLRTKCHPKQLGFYLDPGRRIGVLTSRGCGKSTGGMFRLFRRCLTTHRARCVFIATTRTQAAELVWVQMKDLAEELGLEAKFNETALKMTLKRNGAFIRLVGADDKREIEKLRGQPFHEVGIDEAASHDPVLLDHLLTRIIGPRLGDYNGVLWLIGTPGHQQTGPFYEATRIGSEIAREWDDRDLPEFANWGRWSVHRFNLQDGAPYVKAIAALFKEAQVEKEAKGWSDEHPVWRREYLGQWAADDTERVYRYRPHLEDGTPFNQWDPPRSPQGFAKLPPGDAEWRYVYGMDMGHSDPFVLEVFAFSPIDKTLYHVFEYEKKEMAPRKIAELLLGPELNCEKPSGVIGVTDWPDGMVADTAGLGGMVLEELASVYGIRIEAAEKKNKHDAIELFNGDLQDGRIKILKGSVLEKQLGDLQWQTDDVGRLKEQKGVRNDATDAAVMGRRRASHLLSQEAEKPRPSVGTPEFFNLQMKEEEDRAAGITGGDEFSEFVSDDSNFDDPYWG